MGRWLLGLCLVVSCAATFTWDPNSERDLAGYRLYCGQSSTAPSTLVADVPAPATSYEAPDPLPSGWVYCGLTAYDTTGNESEFSNIVQVVQSGEVPPSVNQPTIQFEELEEPSMPASFVRSAVDVFASTTTAEATLTGVGAGNVVVVLSSCLSATAVFAVEGGGLTYNDQTTTGDGPQMFSAWAHHAAGGDLTVTVTLDEANNGGLVLVEISGADTTAAQDTRKPNEQSNPGTGADAVTTGDTAVPGADGSIFVALVQAQCCTGSTVSAGTGWTEAEPFNSGGINGQGQYLEQATAAADAATWTADPGTEEFASVVVVIAPAAAAGVSGSGALQAQAATVDGAGTGASTGTGTPQAQASDVAAGGVSASTGTGALAAQTSTVDGSGTSESTGTGALDAQAPTIDGAGASSSTGIGALVDGAAVVDGSGAVGGLIAGIGALQAGGATAAGDGISSSTGTGALSGSAAVLDGAGVNAWVGSGLLLAGNAAVVGAGASAAVGSGALAVDAAVLSGIGLSASTGSGELAADAATLTGSGALIVDIETITIVDESLRISSLAGAALVASTVSAEALPSPALTGETLA